MKLHMAKKMKKLNYEIVAPLKIIVIFLLAIFLPSLLVGYLSFSTFSQRRETVKKLLESNLWISGEAVLKSIEEELLDHERKALESENFTRLIHSHKDNNTSISSSVLPKDSAGQLFLLDADFKILFPQTENENSLIFQWGKDLPDSQFARTFQKAEFFEFSQKDYTRAVELYNQCTLPSLSKRYQAIALESLGRCLLSLTKYDEAYKAYNELSQNYSQFKNKAGHPYGIIAALQLYKIDQLLKREPNDPKILLDLYKKIQEGVWPLDIFTYDFFTAEIDLILADACNNGKFPEIRKSYMDLHNRQSPYRQTLVFTDTIKKYVIPKIQEKLSLSPVMDKYTPGRLLIPQEEGFCLISYANLPNFQSEETFYGGISWNLNSIKQITSGVLADKKKDTGLYYQIIDDRGRNILTGKEELLSKESLSLTYRVFPLPWKLLVSHSGMEALERTAHRENIFYGFLLAFIVALMIIGAVLIARDISRESEITRLKTEFVHNISHELKTPLTLIHLFGETLQRKENLTDEERKECYEIITKESERLSHLINNVLDFSRIEMGRKEFVFKKTNLAAVIRNTLESYTYHLEKKGFTIETDIASDIPEMIIDGEAIASVLVNLLSNAMKYSPKKKEVVVKLMRDGENAVLQVKDKGMGISPEEIPKIFQRFYRSQNITASETGGSGLGLTLVKHIIEAHGGRIQVESEPGEGSIFSVILPLSNPERN